MSAKEKVLALVFKLSYTFESEYKWSLNFSCATHSEIQNSEL